MVDIVDAETRSRMMRGIRGKDTKPEMLVRSMLHAAGFRYRVHVRGLPGTPDIVLTKYRAAIFVSGCFWHGHDCHLFRMPATRTEFWQEKIGRNRLNDARAREALLAAGWRHATVWECALRGRGLGAIAQTGVKLEEWIRSSGEECSLQGGP
jgi:DNA mismatch endonuclease (patch repair protein)